MKTISTKNTNNPPYNKRRVRPFLNKVIHIEYTTFRGERNLKEEVTCTLIKSDTTGATIKIDECPVITISYDRIKNIARHYVIEGFFKTTGGRNELLGTEHPKMTHDGNSKKAFDYGVRIAPSKVTRRCK